VELEQRVADLERRLAALESAQQTAPRIGEGDFWALQGFKEQLAELGAAEGGVLFTGAVRLPTGEQYEWQHGALTEGLLDAEWTEAAESFAGWLHTTGRGRYEVPPGRVVPLLVALSAARP
jgi:hypothetical protein